MVGCTKETLISDYARELSRGKATLFIGSGISRKANYVGWKDILKDVAIEIGLDVEQEKDLITLAEYYTRDNQRTKITEAIKDFFADRKGEIQEIHKIIASFPIKDIWTTNYDTLLERGFKHANISTTIITDDDSYKDIDNHAKVKIYKLHGDYKNASKCIITRKDYETYNQTHDIVLAELKGAMCSKSFLFLGYSFSDTDIQHILSKIRLAYDKAHPQRHFCIVEKVKREQYKTDDEYNYANKKQEHRVKDMQSYGINVLLVDSYNEIEDILIRIRNKVYSKNVLISGAYEDDDDLATNRIQPVAEKLANMLIEEGYKIFTGYGKNLGTVIVSGAFVGCTKLGKNVKEFSDNFVIMPFPYKQNETEQKKKLYTSLRENMISKTRICIIIAGKKRKNRSIINSDGVYEEYKIAKESGNLIIPVSSTGGVALTVWDELNQEDYYSKQEAFQKLKTEVSADEIVKLIMQMIKKYREDNYGA